MGEGAVGRWEGVKYATLTNFAFIMVSKFVCPDVRAVPPSPVVLPGNGSDKKDDKNDKKARLPKSEGACEGVVDDSNKSTPHTHKTKQNKTKQDRTETRTEWNVMNNVGRHGEHVSDKEEAVN